MATQAFAARWVRFISSLASWLHWSADRPRNAASLWFARHGSSSRKYWPRKAELVCQRVPYMYGQNSWVIEVEDPTTFYLFIGNGKTVGLDVRSSPYFHSQGT